jgi:hypothetical protein
MNRDSATLPAASDTDPRYRLSIESGPHAGASDVLQPGVYRIGRDASADIILADERMAPLHGQIEIAADCVRITALAGPMTATTGSWRRARNVMPGARREFALPALIECGGTQFRLDGPATARRRRLTPTRALALGVVAPPLVVLFSIAAGWLAHAPVHNLNGANGSPSARMADQAANGGDAVVTDAAAAAQTLRERLAAARLADNISVMVAGGTLVARGTIEPSQAGAWAGVQQWYDGTIPHKVVLVRQVEVKDGPKGPQLAVRAIWAGPIPYIVAGNGEKYGEGAVIDDGWTIERIEPNRLTLTRDGHRIVLDY